MIVKTNFNIGEKVYYLSREDRKIKCGYIGEVCTQSYQTVYGKEQKVRYRLADRIPNLYKSLHFYEDCDIFRDYEELLEHIGLPKDSPTSSQKPNNTPITIPTKYNLGDKVYFFCKSDFRIKYGEIAEIIVNSSIRASKSNTQLTYRLNAYLPSLGAGSYEYQANELYSSLDELYNDIRPKE